MIEAQNFVSDTFVWMMLGPLLVLLAIDGAGRVLQYGAVELARSEEDLWQVRMLQRVQLRYARLGRLLAVLGIDRNRYRRSFSVACMRAQLNVCSACPSKQACDRALACRETPVRNSIEFCPNRNWLLQAVSPSGWP